MGNSNIKLIKALLDDKYNIIEYNDKAVLCIGKDKKANIIIKENGKKLLDEDYIISSIYGRYILFINRIANTINYKSVLVDTEALIKIIETDRCLVQVGDLMYEDNTLGIFEKSNIHAVGRGQIKECDGDTKIELLDTAKKSQILEDSSINKIKIRKNAELYILKTKFTDEKGIERCKYTVLSYEYNLNEWIEYIETDGRVDVEYLGNGLIMQSTANEASKKIKITQFYKEEQ